MPSLRYALKIHPLRYEVRAVLDLRPGPRIKADRSSGLAGQGGISSGGRGGYGCVPAEMPSFPRHAP